MGLEYKEEGTADKMKKKKIIKIICIVLIFALVGAGGFGIYVFNRFNSNKMDAVHSYDKIYSREAVTYDVGEDGEFAVLKINDTHFFDGVCEKDKHTLEDLKAILDKTPCDLIVINGDMVDGFNLKLSYDKQQSTALLAELLESYDIPWTFAPGNNDSEMDGENEDIIAFMMQYENFICGNEKDIDGDMQFFIDLTYEDELAHTIAIMDSNARSPKVIGGYDYIKENQINWLLNGIEERGVKTSVFFHMNTPAFKTAYEEGEVYEGFPSEYVFPLDDIKKNELFDNMTADNEYISLISIGHVHSNDMCRFYNGRYYQLSSVSGYSAIRLGDMIPSCTLTVIDVTEEDKQEMYEFSKVTAE